MAKWYLGAGLFCALLLVGCYGKNTTYTVTGTVMFEGKPLPDGDIIFLDPDNKVGPDAGKVVDGKFSFKAKAGKKRVEIRASRKEKLPPGKTGAMGETEMNVDYIGEKYNSKSELTAEVTAGGPTTFEFKVAEK
jgi:hypothetical protein